jgi:transposase
MPQPEQRARWQAAAMAGRADVEAQLRRRDLSRRQRERLELVQGLALGKDLAALCAWSGRSPRRVAVWLERFVAGGSAALVDAPRSGRPPKADAAYRAALVQAVETAPRTLGLEVDVWTAARLSTYLAQQTGTAIAPGWLRALLAQERFVCGRPKHTLHQLQDADAVAASVAELAALGEKGGRRTGAL